MRKGIFFQVLSIGIVSVLITSTLISSTVDTHASTEPTLLKYKSDEIIVRYKPNTNQSIKSAIAGKYSISQYTCSISDNTCVIKANPNDLNLKIKELNENPNVEAADYNYIRTINSYKVQNEPKVFR